MADHPASNNRRQRKKRRQQLERKLKQNRPSENRHQSDNPVVGYVAIKGVNVVCDEQQCCVVCGSRAAMKSFIENHDDPLVDYEIQKATANQILKAMSVGGQYVMDEQAYMRFMGPARAAGLPVGDRAFPDGGCEGISMIRLGPFLLLPDEDQ